MKTAWTRTLRISSAIWRFAKRHLPRWLVVVLGVAALIPGPFDEILIALVLMALVVSSRRRRTLFCRYMRTAWRLA